MFNYITFLIFGKKIQFFTFPVKFSILVKCKIAAKIAATSDDVIGPQRSHTP